MSSRWYTSDVHTVILYIKVFIPPWHQDFHPSTEEIGVKCPYPGSDRLLHIGMPCKSLDSQVQLKGTKEMEIAGCKIRTVRKVVHILPDTAL
jgi:hypothetical protein